MQYDIAVVGGGASGMMAAFVAARSAADAGESVRVCILEKMPRPGRKIMITGKGRCNFTNLKSWNEFSSHVRSGSKFIKSAFHAFPPGKTIEFFEGFGTKTVVERGDRAFPASYHAGDIVDTLVSACNSVGVSFLTETEVLSIEKDSRGFRLSTSAGEAIICRKLIIATGGLSYPSTGSTGDGLKWAEALGLRVEPTFPSLTALVPKGYKNVVGKAVHIPRETELSELGNAFCGIQLKNVGVTLEIDGNEAGSEFGDIDFTDGGIEGPIGFQLSRKAVKALVNGSKAELSIDLKPGVNLTDLTCRVKDLWAEVDRDPRSERLREKEKCRIMLGKLMPWDLIPGFMAAHPETITLERRSRTETKVWVNLVSIAKALKDLRFPLAGFVGYERAVVTAGGVDTDELFPKTLESRKVPGLYFTGEVIDCDCDTGGYNLQTAFSTGYLAGSSASKSLFD